MSRSRRVNNVDVAGFIGLAQKSTLVSLRSHSDDEDGFGGTMMTTRMDALIVPGTILMMPMTCLPTESSLPQKKVSEESVFTIVPVLAGPKMATFSAAL